MIYKKFLQISRETGLPVKKVLEMFYILKSGDMIENNELLQKLGVSRNVLNQVKKSLSFFLESPSGTTKLKSKKLKSIQGVFGKEFIPEGQLWEMFKGKDFERIIALLNRYKSVRPDSKREYDQFTATPETTAMRACLMNFLADIEGKRILFLGDDDFTSVAVALFNVAQTIEVLDIDERVLTAIKRVTKKESLRISTVKYDVRQKLPDTLVGRFDVVFTDPPYTPEGINLFLSKGIQALDPENKAARIYICYGNSDKAKERFLPVYETFVRSGLMVRWIFDKFNRYAGAESIGSASSLFVCDVTPKTKPLIKGVFNEPIYTDN